MTDIKDVLPDDVKNIKPNEQHPDKFELTIKVEELQKKSIFLATPMYGGQCLFSQSNIMTENGEMSIKDIVNSKYSGKVLSFDEKTKTFVWDKVIGWSVENNKEKKKKWLRVATGRGKKRVVVTSDHECGVIDNPLDPKVYFDKAENISGKYIVKNTLQKLFNKDQISVVIGTLLGDACVKKTGAYITSHCLKQKEYLEYTQNILGGVIREEENRPGSFEGATQQFKLRLPVNAQTNYLRELMYIGKKTVKYVIPYINEISLAFWYMDDGYISANYYKKEKTSQYAMLCSDGFSREDCELLVNLLQDKWDITASVIKYRKYFRIALSVEGSKIFWKVISPYIHETMRYKLPVNFEYPEQILLDNNLLAFGCDKVKITDHDKFSRLYDITVEKNHNFVADDCLVHNCAGLYTRSVVALSEMCMKYGIKLQMYFMFNESLITRARNYCADEFLRSGCTHLMFIDSDIGFDPKDVIALLALQSDESPYDVIAGSYPKKSLPSNTIIITEDGPKTIKELVTTKYTGKVLSQNKFGKLEYKSVINHMVSYNPIKKWIDLKVNRVSKKLTCTYDHEIAVIDDVLNPDIYYTEARNALGKYSVRIPIDNGMKIQNENRLYNKEQLSFLIGTLLADGNISKKNLVRFGHSDKQLEYLNLKKYLFHGHEIQEARSGSAYRDKPYFASKFDCPINAQTKRLRELIYPEGKKTLINVIDMFDDKALAFFYLDDGSFGKKDGSVVICTERFSYDEHIILQKHFKAKFDIVINITHRGRSDDDRYRIYIPKDQRDKFFELVSKYVPKSMEHKLPEKFRNGYKHIFNNELLDYTAAKIISIEKAGRWNLEDPNYQYDVTVEDNHNFIANGYVVSNCIAYEKLVVAVNKGFADENPNALENFIGDYVFNPKIVPGQTSIAINKPVEVMETGTGFMMIRRKTFEDFEKAFPELHYRPDHVRTEHFDGTREIMAYFDTIIDPVTKRYLSEDYMFTQFVQKMGGQVWLCPWMQLQHVGSFVFGGSLAALAAIGVSPTADPKEMERIKNAVGGHSGQRK